MFYNKRYFHILVVLLLCESCGWEQHKYEHRTIEFTNNSYLDLSVYGAPSWEYVGYPNRIDTIDYYGGHYQERYFVPQNTSSKEALDMFRRNTYELIFRSSDYYYIFIHKGVTSKEQIEYRDLPSGARIYPYIARYDVTLEDLASLDWRICFPPSVEMAGVRMWPPYEDLVAKYNPE